MTCLSKIRTCAILCGSALLLATTVHALSAADEMGVKVVATFGGHSEPVYGVASSPDGKLVATGSLDKSVKLFDAGSGKLVRTFAGPQGHSKMVLTVAFSPDGRQLASGGEDKILKIWDVPSTGPVMTLAQQRVLTSLALNGAAANAMAVAGSLYQTLTPRRPAADTPVKEFPHPNSITCVAFSADGTKVVTGAADGRLRIFDLAKGALSKEIAAHVAPNAMTIYGIAFRPQHDQVATAGYDGAARVWDIVTGKMVREFRAYRVLYVRTPGHRESIYCLAFSPDGKYLATGSAGLENLIKIWDMDKGFVRDLVNPQEKQPPGYERSHPGWIYGLAYTTDGKYLVSAGNAPASRGYLGLWEPETGKLVHGEEMPLGAFFSMRLMPGDRTVLVGAGARGKTPNDVNKAYILTLPLPGK